MDIKSCVGRIKDLVEEIQVYENYKKNFLRNLDILNQDYKKGVIDEAEYQTKLKQFLKDKSKEEWIAYYDTYVLHLLKQIEDFNKDINGFFQSSPAKVADAKVPAVPSVKGSEKVQQKVLVASGDAISKLDPKTKQAYLRSLGVKSDEVKRFVWGIKSKKAKKKKLPVRTKYVIYEPNSFGKVANLFVRKLTMQVTNKYPKAFESLYHALRASDVKVLSKTYISIMLFSSIIAFFFFMLFVFIFLDKTSIIFAIVRSIFLGLAGTGLTFFVIYMYPFMLVNSRKREIKEDLPFVIIHMAAVAGSGAHPMTMFNLLLSSEEYKGIKGEIKKIVNYVNLFGYDLSTALRAVALTTPSPAFRELLNGIVATITTGGNLSDYLKEKANDALATYKLERKKYVEVLATYSDIYTGILIAAPLLFMVTLAIINTLSAKIAGMTISTIANVGIYIVLPVLNGAFILFLNTMQPEA